MGVVANIAVNLDATKALSGVNGLNKAVSGLSSGVDKAAKGQNVFNQSVANTEAAIKKQIQVLQETKSKLDINSQAYRDVAATITAYEQRLKAAGIANKTFAEQIQGVGQKVSSVGQAMSGLAGIAASIGAGAALNGFVRAGIEADRTAKTIKALSGQYKETAAVTKLANDAARQYGLGQTTAAKAVADLYGRLRPMGVSLDNIGKTFNGVNKAAALMNLTAAETDGVLLQLSQAMGSGALQGDELRSIMERLPAVGQAVAKVMGVTVGEVKQLGADGKITTDILIKAMDELNKIQPPPPDAYKAFQAAIQDLNTAIGTQLLPIFTPLVQKLTEVVAKFQELGVGATVAQALVPLGDMMLKLLEAFMQLDPGIQQFIIQFGAIAGAVSLIIVPLGLVVQAFGAIITAVGGVMTAIGGLSIFATLAGWLGALMPAITAVVTLLTGPVGIVVALVAVGTAAFAFREQIGQAFQAVGQYLRDLGAGFNILLQEATNAGQGVVNWFTEGWAGLIELIKQPFVAGWQFIQESFLAPVQQAFVQSVQFIQTAWSNMQQIISSPFVAAVGAVKSALNAIMGAVQGAVNGAIAAINRVIAAANRVPGVNISQISSVSLPSFAEGGVVKGPTIAMVGEGGEPEYIVPQSKAAGFAQNWISGKRGIGAIPAFAEGGMAMPSASVSIQTGPVTQMNGANYVTTQDLSRAVQAGVNQTLSLIAGDGSVRRQLGMA